MTESVMTSPQKPCSILQQVDEILAQNVMGWELWNGDWWSHPDDSTGKRKFQTPYLLWNPTADYECSMELWLKCLARAAATGYRVTTGMDDDGLIEIVGNHTVRPQLVVADRSVNVAICCFAFALFSLEMPCPYNRSIIKS